MTETLYPSYTVIDPFRSEDWIVRFPHSLFGLVDAIEYCIENDLAGIRFSKDENHVEIVWKK
jgi:hypothetical protein